MDGAVRDLPVAQLRGLLGRMTKRVRSPSGWIGGSFSDSFWTPMCSAVSVTATATTAQLKPKLTTRAVR